MNEHRLGRLLKRIVLLSAPLPTALLASACGSATTDDPAAMYPTAGANASGAAAGSNAVGTGGSVASGGSVAVSSSGSAGAQNSAGTGGLGVCPLSLGGSAGSGGTQALPSAGAAQGETAGAAGSANGGGGAGGSDGANGGVSGDGANGQLGGGGAFIIPIKVCEHNMVTVPLACLPGDVATSAGSFIPVATCRVICGPDASSCNVESATAATVTATCTIGCGSGRRPPGFCPSPFFETHAIGQYFAQIAELEAASVDAFRILRAELRALGAPKRLLRATGRAARDEIRHARATRALARRSGTQATPPARVPAPQRSLEAIARENAVEGCVRETFGALLATWQASHAADPVVRAAMSRISRDETRHAALSWQVQRWLNSRLDPAARARIATARREAAQQLLQDLSTEPTPTFAEHIGLPASAHAQKLASKLAEQLWS